MNKFQIQLEKAQKKGYKYIASIVKSVYNTEYYNVQSINDLMTESKWIAAPYGQYSTADGGGTWYGPNGQRELPANTLMRTKLYSL